VVDLGAGTGQFAIAAAAEFARVIAVDVSPVMLRRLRSKAEAGGRANLEVVQAGFLTYEHDGPPADAVYSRYALHHLPDFWKAVALSRMHGMLRAGGIVRLSDVVYNFTASEAPRSIEAWCATGSDDVEADWSRAELEEHVRDENSTFTWLLEPMIERTGFTITDATYSDDGFVAQYVLTTS
jgi:ubiquinone/menaquinone biosynthesis C-methylase UbiE